MEDKKSGIWIFHLDSIIWVICSVKININTESHRHILNTDPVLSMQSYQNINFSNNKCKFYIIKTPGMIHPPEIILINRAHRALGSCMNWRTAWRQRHNTFGTNTEFKSCAGIFSPQAGSTQHFQSWIITPPPPLHFMVSSLVFVWFSSLL